MLEDDFHCMSVEVAHDGNVANSVTAKHIRVPWTTCPGAINVLAETFVGKTLADFERVGGKKVNCTHLYDLALWCAAHAQNNSTVVYDVLVSDPVDAISEAEIRKNGQTVLHWDLSAFNLIYPADIAGLRLDQMRPWIETLDEESKESAKILQWGCMIAHGRTRPMELQSDATKMPANCYTFQPEQAIIADRIGDIKDFSSGDLIPLQAIAADG